jgi:hypothetical protein
VPQAESGIALLLDSKKFSANFSPQDIARNSRSADEHFALIIDSIGEIR